VSEPVAGVPDWHPDPSGRHEFRWFDGTAFTDQVSDGGQITTDPGAVAPPVAPAQPPPVWPPAAAPPDSVWAPPSPTVGPATTPWAPPPPAPPPLGAPPAPSRGRAVRTPLLLVAVGMVVVLAAAAYLLLADDGGSAGTGTFEATLDADTPAVAHRVTVAAGAALTVEVDPSGDLDAVVAVVVSDANADELDDLLRDLGGAGARRLDDSGFTVDLAEVDGIDGEAVTVLRTDVGFAGEVEQVLLAVPFELEASIVVLPFDEESNEGDYEITIEAIDLDVDDDADAEDLLEAVADDDSVADDFRDFADELLDELG